MSVRFKLSRQVTKLLELARPATQSWLRAIADPLGAERSGDLEAFKAIAEAGDERAK